MPDPERARLRPALRQVSRWVCRIHQQGGGLCDAVGLAVWTLPRKDSVDPAPVGRWRAERLHDGQPLPWLAASQAGKLAKLTEAAVSMAIGWSLATPGWPGPSGPAPRCYRKLPVGA